MYYRNICECGENVTEEMFLSNVKHNKCNYHCYLSNNSLIRVSLKCDLINDKYSVLTYYDDLDHISEFIFYINTYTWSNPKKIIEHNFEFKEYEFEDLNIILDFLKSLKENIIFI